MKKILLALLVGIFLISFISPLDEQLPQVCGGDDQLIIACIGDEQLTFLAGLEPSVGGPGGGGGGAIVNITEEEVPPVIVKKVIDWVLATLCAILCFILFLLIFRKKKCEKCKKRYWAAGM